MAWSSEVSRRTELRLPTFPSKRITPATSPEEIIRRSAFGGWCPENPVITRAPASWSSVAGAASVSAIAARAASTRPRYRLGRDGLHDQESERGLGRGGRGG